MNKAIDAIQVCYELTEVNQEREFEGLYAAMSFFNFDEGKIITLNQEDEIKFKNKTIHIIPLKKWLR